MLIVHVYTPLLRFREQQPTWEALAGLRGRWRIVHEATPGEGGFYSRVLARHWDKGEFVLCEQDIVPEADMIEAFERCPEPACVQAYQIYPVSTGMEEPVFAQFVHWHGGRRSIEAGEAWADESGTGLCRFRAELQVQIPATELLADTWYEAERRITAAFMKRGIRWHVHFPAAKHNHA